VLTVLLVDDDRLVLGLCSCVLAAIPGICILKAEAGCEALDIAARHEGAIDLLLSDISMPGEMNGVQLAERLVVARPAIKVLLMSGYSDNLQLRAAWHFLSKPFFPAGLVARIEETLGRELPAVTAPQEAMQTGKC
jgi:two-component system, cell cycle sensor histidine kinase and response regulator CckA